MSEDKLAQAARAVIDALHDVPIHCYSKTANKAMCDLRAALAAHQAQQTDLQSRFDALLASEHALSDSYVRVREIIGAMNPPVLEPAALYAYVEDCARKFVKPSHVQGWQWVPVEPTPEMLSCIVHSEYPADWQAGKRLQRDQRGDNRVPFKTEYEIAVGQYQRLLAAAPQQGDRTP